MQRHTVPVSDTSVTTDERTDHRTSDGDHDRFAHYVQKPDIVRSAVTGEAVIALCGKKWVPTRNPDNDPVCPECKAIHRAANPNLY